MHDTIFGLHGFGWVFWVVIILLLAVFAIRYFNPQSREQKETALEILKKRYAAGELTDSDYEKMKKKLK